MVLWYIVYMIIHALLSILGCYIAPNSKSKTFELESTVLNLTMAGGGYVAGFPEVAKMTYHLQFGEGKKLSEDGEFLLESSHVRDGLRRLKKPGSQARVVWTHDQMWQDSPRVAFAANPMKFVRVDDDPGTGCPSYVGSIWVSYPKKSRTTLIPGVLEVEEGAFHELERRGVMRPYLAEYHVTTCDLTSEDRDTPWVDDLLEDIWSMR